MRVPDCHPERKHKAFGFCNLCYWRFAGKRWYKKNKDVRIVAIKKYRAKFPELCKARRQRWEQENKARINFTRKLRFQVNINARLGRNLRKRVRDAIKQRKPSCKKFGSTFELLGCSVSEVRLHLEKQFQPGMSWDNYGSGDDRWSIDHIIPVIAFDLTDSFQQKACFHYTNLQPLWCLENSRKATRIQ